MTIFLDYHRVDKTVFSRHTCKDPCSTASIITGMCTPYHQSRYVCRTCHEGCAFVCCWVSPDLQDLTWPYAPLIAFAHKVAVDQRSYDCVGWDQLCLKLTCSLCLLLTADGLKKPTTNYHRVCFETCMSYSFVLLHESCFWFVWACMHTAQAKYVQLGNCLEGLHNVPYSTVATCYKNRDSCMHTISDHPLSPKLSLHDITKSYSECLLQASSEIW